MLFNNLNYIHWVRRQKARPRTQITSLFLFFICMLIGMNLEAKPPSIIHVDGHSLATALTQAGEESLDARRLAYFNHLYFAEIQTADGELIMLRDVLKKAIASVETINKDDKEVRAELMKAIAPILKMKLESGETLASIVSPQDIIQSEPLTPAFCNPDDPFCNCTDPVMCPISPSPAPLPAVSHYEHSVKFRAWYVLLAIQHVELSGKVVQVHENGEKQPYYVDRITLHVGNIPGLAHCGWDLDDYSRGYVSASRVWKTTTSYTDWVVLPQHFKMTWRFTDSNFSQSSLPTTSTRHCTFNWVFDKTQIRYKK